MNEADVIDALKSFFAAMGKWEADCKALYRAAKTTSTAAAHEELKKYSLSELRKIFREFCTTWETPARARFGWPHFSTIPTYGEELETVLTVEVHGDEATVLTQQTTGPKDKLVYRLKYCEGKWRIEDNRKRVDLDGDEVDWDL